MSRIYLLVLVAVGLGFLAARTPAQEGKAEVIKGWGQVTDPDADCTIKAEDGKLVITVPEKNHNLNPAIGVNAPRVMQDVDGDFTLQVRVSGEFKPSDQSTLPGGASFNGAGLLVWDNDKNFLRLERNSWRIPDKNLSVCYPPLVEYYKEGAYQDTNPPAELDSFFKGNSTYLRLERRGDKITAFLSHDGKDWTTVKQVDTSLPKKVKVGVAAINTSDRPFKVEFDELRLTTK